MPGIGVAMQLTEFDHQGIIERNRRECSPFFDQLRWIDPSEAPRMEDERRELLDFLSKRALTAFNRTMPYVSGLSPGCRLCGEGFWSCLFINNICNARCFYCPSPQDKTDQPGTSTLTFTHPGDYVDYLERFGFRGGSISGGEPFMTFDRTLSFVAGIKRRLGARIYLWLYTNGILATPEKLARLRDAGLDEIRFNIGASGFSLEGVSKAVGLIPRVTVEVPAVPERLDLLAGLIPRMYELGVSFLNLHQIRCTAFNYPKLIERGYTFAHGPLIGVVESELAALRLLSHAAGQGIGMGVNYCSLIYRHRFQTRAARLRWAAFLRRGHEDLTDAGMIRSLSAAADPGLLSRLREACPAGEGSPVSEQNGRVLFGRALLDLPGPPLKGLRVSNHHASIHPGVTYRNTYREVRFNARKTVVLERVQTGPAIELDPAEIQAFRAVTGGDCSPPEDPEALLRRFPELGQTPDARGKWAAILYAERFRPGLLEYY